MTKRSRQPTGHTPPPAPAPEAPADGAGDGDPSPPPFTFKDRRFWARKDGEREGEAAEPAAARDPGAPEVVPAPDPADSREAPSEGAGDGPPPPDPRIAELERALAAKEERLQATLGQYRDALADFEAARARLKRDVQKDIDAGRRAFLVELLEVLDNLDRAVTSAAADPEVAKSALYAGVTMVREQFLAKLAALGVRPLEGLGRPFDPARFEAVSVLPVADPAQDGKIVGVMRTCYLIGEDTLRHGIVAVGAAEKKAD